MNHLIYTSNAWQWKEQNFCVWKREICRGLKSPPKFEDMRPNLSPVIKRLCWEHQCICGHLKWLSYICLLWPDVKSNTQYPHTVSALWRCFKAPTACVSEVPHSAASSALKCHTVLDPRDHMITRNTSSHWNCILCRNIFWCYDTEGLINSLTEVAFERYHFQGMPQKCNASSNASHRTHSECGTMRKARSQSN